MMPMIKETPFNDKTQNDTTLKSWIDDGFMPLIYKGEMMDLSRGRAISRENENQSLSICNSNEIIVEIK
ncbi:hypothetical protein UM594_08130 [Staphylococcus aureus]|nr:hypothetical protein UM594_08130 [Staphylococcus aureus]